jgi:predicted DNA-binding transcriptional regulator AlpA
VPSARRPYPEIQPVLVSYSDDEARERAVPPIRLALRLAEAAAAVGLSRRMVERLRAAGKFPKPDAHAGRAPLWRPATLDHWIKEGGSQ